MPIRIKLFPPINPSRISRIRIYRSLFADGGFSMVSDLMAHDSYGNFVSAYEDVCGRMDHYYKVGYLEDGERLISMYTMYKDSAMGRQMFVFPDGSSLVSGTAIAPDEYGAGGTYNSIIIGYESTRADFETNHGALPPSVGYYGSADFMKKVSVSYVLSLYDTDAKIVTDMTYRYEHTSNSVRVEWTPRETVTEPFRMCSAQPVQIIYSTPDVPKDWQVDTIYVMRSDEIDGDYSVISKLTSKSSEYGSWRTSFVDLGGSDSFFYKVVFMFSRWNDNECKSEFHTSEPSNAVSAIAIDGNLVAKITVGHLSINDQRTSEQIKFNTYPYCGYHRFSPQDVLKGTNASPYSRPNDMGVGNECAGNGLFGGPLSIYERNIQQQQMLLDTTGESVILLRRKWDGKQCPCVSKTEEHPTKQCPTCFGTGFVGAYDRIYFNDDANNPEGRIMLRFFPAVDDLALRKFAGLDVVNQPSAWTIAQPIVRDRDIIVQFDPIDKEREIWRYEVLDVTRNAFVGGVSGAQVMRLQRLNRLNDIAYSFPLAGYFETELWDMQSNMHNSFGHNTGQRSGEHISVDEVPSTVMPTATDADLIMDAYARKLWPFIRANIVPDPKMVLDFSGPLYPIAFISFGDKSTMVQVNPAYETINNYSILRYSRVEIDSSLLKDYVVDIRSINSGALLHSLVLPSNTIKGSYPEEFTFKDSVKLVLNQSVKMKSLVLLLVERV